MTQLGRSDEGVDPWTPSHIEAAVGLIAYNKWPAGETKQTLIKRMNERLSQLPGFSSAVSQPIADMVNDLTEEPTARS